jgi:recombination protein RecA
MELVNLVNAAVGQDALKLASDETFKTSFIPTGLLPIDCLLQGGLPRGRFTEIVGDYSTLKSFVGLSAIAECQKAGGIAALIDTERAFDPEWAEEVGVNVKDLIIYPPRDADPGQYFPGELAIDVAETLTRQKVDLIVFDSIAATLPQAEQNKRLHDENVQPARLAALMSVASRKLTAANSKTAFLFVNQFRINVGMTFGDPNVITGGKAMGYFASYILIMKKVGKITRDAKAFDGEKFRTVKEQTVQKYQANLSKSKLNKPFRDVFFDWSLIDEGIDIVSYLVAQGIDLGLIKKSGNTWKYKNVSAVGKDKFYQAVRASDSAQRGLENAIREANGLQLLESPTPATKAREKAVQGSTRPKRSLKRR